MTFTEIAAYLKSWLAYMAKPFFFYVAAAIILAIAITVLIVALGRRPEDFIGCYAVDFLLTFIVIYAEGMMALFYPKYRRW